MAKYFGYNFPFYDETFVLPMQVGLKLIKNDVKQLLLTGPGERVMRPTYGTVIRNFPFELGDQRSFDELRGSISFALARYEPRVILRDIIISPNLDQNLIQVSIIMALTTSPQIEFNVALRLANSSSNATVQTSVQ